MYHANRRPVILGWHAARPAPGLQPCTASVASRSQQQTQAPAAPRARSTIGIAAGRQLRAGLVVWELSRTLANVPAISVRFQRQGRRCAAMERIFDDGGLMQQRAAAARGGGARPAGAIGSDDGARTRGRADVVVGTARTTSRTGSAEAG